ncbi:methyltransferase [Paraburkholderia azotifigens]|uniref:Methyltransferase n=1 Tax=Paraburkholderia azotifigens TaxID=2057004 RepID=A0A5C6V827_9BURK|nr:methyltransferase [Paraburkholderia azotifigens]TXC80920.1 methyltransferase [Paraburkholderia azotifigens]
MARTPDTEQQAPRADHAADAAPSPEHILQVAMGFWASKTLLSAVELKLFTHLARGPQNATQLTETLGLHPRPALDFLDALVALNVLNRVDGVYSNTRDADVFLDQEKPAYIGGLLEMANSRLYPFWGSLTEALRTGAPQNESKHGGNVFEAIYSDEARLRTFLHAMSGVSLGAARAIAQQFPWRNYRTFIDIGTAQGALPVQIALAHPHLTGGGFDLPPVGPVFEEYVASQGLQERLKFHAGNFFDDPCPGADVLVMGHILHDWDLDQKRTLLRKCHDALPEGGCLIVYDAMIDDDRRHNAFGLLMSLNMLIETRGGFDYTGAQCIEWMREAGFRDVRVEPLAGADSMAVGIR